MSGTGGAAGTGGAQEEDKKPMDQSAHINLKVKGQILAMVENSIAVGHVLQEQPEFSVLIRRISALWLNDLDGNEVFFRIKRSTQLRKLMNAYCDRQSVDINSIAFLFDGRRLRGEQTPDELEMEDGDEIDAMLHQTGGCCLVA